MKKHLQINIYGKVQGVFFRASAKRKAEELDAAGYAENLPDGSVFIEAEGEEPKLKELLGWCKKGSEAARVENVNFEFSDNLKDFKGFETK